ncbi:RNA 2',3'-cyclic phosphodiesterase [Tundrisphaera sp. TA3]|uniref:RNA 2',3'-cyclic phosphodiesterase n=1 Tax=Tundrisphaera sp. TA3 TaxID=3435775 RepID=UPI003EBC5371
MAHATRTFVAVAIPPAQRTRLARLQTLIAPDLPSARWVLTEQFHVTLAFLGDIPDTDLNGLCRAIAAAVESHRPFSLTLQGLGMFPGPVKPRVAWVGLVGPELDALAALRADIVAAVASVGYPPEDNRFTPHVTIGRIKATRGDEVDASGLVAHFRSWLAGAVPVAEVVTYASTLTPEGPAYMPLARAPLKGKGGGRVRRDDT